MASTLSCRQMGGTTAVASTGALSHGFAHRGGAGFVETDGTLADGASEGRGRGGTPGGPRAAQLDERTGGSLAQADDGWVGKRVVQKYGELQAQDRKPGHRSQGDS